MEVSGGRSRGPLRRRAGAVPECTRQLSGARTGPVGPATRHRIVFGPLMYELIMNRHFVAFLLLRCDFFVITIQSSAFQSEKYCRFGDKNNFQWSSPLPQGVAGGVENHPFSASLPRLFYPASTPTHSYIRFTLSIYSYHCPLPMTRLTFVH